MTCSVEDLIDQVVKTCTVVAFVKGTRTQPQSGVSHKVLTILTEVGLFIFLVQHAAVNYIVKIYKPVNTEANSYNMPRHVELSLKWSTFLMKYTTLAFERQ